MKLSELLADRQKLIRRATLANLAYAYRTLDALGARAEKAGLRGKVRLQRICDAEDGYWAGLTALEGSQSVVEEHFTENDIIEMAEAVFFSIDQGPCDVTFPLEQFSEQFVGPLAKSLRKAGVAFDLPESSSLQENVRDDEAVGQPDDSTTGTASGE